jgi:integrase
LPPLANSSIRQIHGILSGACRRAAKWGWITTNPIHQADPPAAPKSDPHPPSVAQAAAIISAAWQDPDWGLLVWLATTTGVRRSELCALRWSHVDWDTGILTVRRSIAQKNAKVWEKDTKTHQRRRISLDPLTLALLRANHQRRQEIAAALGLTLDDDAFIFSPDPDGGTALKPSTVSQRYARMCARLGWDMNIQQLRHYSATELIAAGVDVRTVAGRLGHGGGGTTTLKVYSAWVPEADERAATAIATRMPTPPTDLAAHANQAPAVTEDLQTQGPYQQIAADLRSAIRCGVLQPGDTLPPVAELASRYGVAASTAHRAIAQLHDAGIIDVARGRRATVAGSEPMPAEVINR